MSMIFSAGNKRPNWVPSPKELTKTAQADTSIIEEDTDPFLDAIKGLPGVGDESVGEPLGSQPVSAPESPEAAVGEPPVEGAPEVSPLPPTADIAAPVGGETTEEQALDEVKIKLEETQLAVAKLQDAVEECKEEGAPATTDSAPADASPAGDTVHEVEIEVEEDKPSEIPGVKDEKKDESKDESKDEPKKDEPKDESKDEKKDEKPVEKESCSTADAAPVFVRVAKLSSKNRSDLREYWTSLGFPSEYVDAMVKDYEG